LCALLDKVGPGAPTLCEGWKTVDLAAHLVLREHRPDAAAGIMGGPLASYTARVQRGLAEGTPYNLLVERIRNGPPKMSLFGVPGVDARANFAEYLVHHEDVRRAQPDWEPRDLEPGLTEEIWTQLRRAKLMLRKIPVGIEFARDDLPDQPDKPERAEHQDGHRVVRMTVRQRTPMVTVIGAPAELMMWSCGRTDAARVRLDGAEADVAALSQARWGV